MKKLPKQGYTAEFKELAVKRVKDGQSNGGVAKELGVSDQTLRNWVNAFDAGKLSGPGTKVVALEQRELSRMRAENARLRMEVAILKKSDGILRERCAVRYAWIDTQRKRSIRCR